MSGPLAGLTVLDLTRFYSGPFATLLLAGLGAQVIRIDQPGRGDPAMSGPPFFGPEGVGIERSSAADLGLAYLKRCRGKKSITLDIGSAEGLGIFHRLLAKSDVLVENFRPGVTEKLRIDYAANRRLNPRIVHCAITGYGSTGPDRDLRAYDLMIQAATGLMSITGDPDGVPRKAGSAMADGIAGTFAVSGILAAVIEARASGEGQFVDVAMADCLTALVLDEPLDCYARLGLETRQGNRIMRFSPFDTFATRDGTVVIGAATNEEWRSLLIAMGQEALTHDAQIMSTGWRITHNDAVDRLVTAWTATLTTAAVLETLRLHDVPSSPVRDIADLMAWPHLRAREMLAPVPHPAGVVGHEAVAAGFPLKLSRTAGGYAAPAPTLGQHSEEVYADLLGLTADEVGALRARKIV